MTDLDYPQEPVKQDLQPDLEQTSLFLRVLTGEADPVITFQVFDDDSQRKNKRLNRIFHGTLKECCEALTRLNRKGAGVHVMINKGDGKGRAAANTIAVRAVFVDLDGAPLVPVKYAPTTPNIVVESSPGRFHCYWLVSDCPLELFGSIQKALSKKFNGDPACCDLPRVMRLCGFFHRKSEVAFMTRLLEVNG